MRRPQEHVATRRLLSLSYQAEERRLSQRWCLKRYVLLSAMSLSIAHEHVFIRSCNVYLELSRRLRSQGFRLHPSGSLEDCPSVLFVTGSTLPHFVYMYVSSRSCAGLQDRPVTMKSASVEVQVQGTRKLRMISSATDCLRGMVAPHHPRQGPSIDIHAHCRRQKVAFLGIPLHASDQCSR